MAVFRYKGSKVYTMDFQFHGQRIRETTRTRSKTLAEQIERKRRQELEDGVTGARRTSPKPKFFTPVADDWLSLRKATVAASTLAIDNASLRHLKPVFGRKLISEITGRHVIEYQKKRQEQEAAPKTINLEYGTLRSILRFAGAWDRIRKGTRMLTVNEDVGRAITAAEEAALIEACAGSRARYLLAFVLLALDTGARSGTIRTLRWQNIDLDAKSLKWGKDKTRAGTGRVVPLTDRTIAALEMWATYFPNRQPEHYVFPKLKYFTGGEDFDPAKSAVDPKHPVKSVKIAWRFARKRAGRILAGRPTDIEAPALRCRFHDLRHTAATRMLNRGVPIPLVGKILGWSPAMQVKMAARYGHFTLDDMRSAVNAINTGDFTGDPGAKRGVIGSKHPIADRGRKLRNGAGESRPS